MIYALIFAAIAAVAGLYGMVEATPGGAIVAKTIYLMSLVMFVVFLALAKLTKEEEPPFP